MNELKPRNAHEPFKEAIEYAIRLSALKNIIICVLIYLLTARLAGFLIMPQIIFFWPPERIVISALLLFLSDVLMFLIPAFLTKHQSEQMKRVN